jgi:hypothetical protein
MLSQSSKRSHEPDAGGPGFAGAQPGLQPRRGLRLVISGAAMSVMSLIGLVLVLANAKELTNNTSEDLGFLLIPMGMLFGLGLLFLVFGAVYYGKTFVRPEQRTAGYRDSVTS